MARLPPTAQAFSELVLEVFRVNGLALAAGDVLCGPAGLTSARWQVLGVVDHGAAPVANVARTMGLTRQSVQLTADALERDGFVAYEDNPHHRRAKLIAITDAGRRALRAVEGRHAEWAQRLGKKIGAAALRAAVASLQEVRAALEGEAAPSGEPELRRGESQ
jgi:DNA-binding MarR family transcriptional regulator